MSPPPPLGLIRYVRFLVCYLMLENTIDILNSSNGYSSLLPSKIAPLTVTSEGPRISQPLVL